MTEYVDDNFVYIDTDTRKVVGLVEWTPEGNVKPLKMPTREEVEEAEETKPESEAKKKPERRRRVFRQRYYPWCSYRTARRFYRVEGKEKEIENYRSLDEVMTKSQLEPFWS